MRTWEQLLGVVRSIEENPEEYGPHTKQLLSMGYVLNRANWYGSVTLPSSIDDTVCRVKSWAEAWTILGDLEEVRYTVHGSLVAACDMVDIALASDPQRKAWWRAFSCRFRESVSVPSPPLDPAWDSDRTALVLDYAVDVIDYAMKEIIVSDMVECTYFRQHFQWFAYGYFPCGWEGEWPAGKLRVL